jgi:hypothetical protein
MEIQNGPRWQCPVPAGKSPSKISRASRTDVSGSGLIVRRVSILVGGFQSIAFLCTHIKITIVIRGRKEHQNVFVKPARIQLKCNK